MNALLAELLKLRRSAIWVVVVVLPLLSVITGTVNYVGNAGAFQAEWNSYWSQVTLFYALIFCSVGIAVLCSAIWRMEHLGNWPRLMSGPTSTLAVVGAKLGALAVLVGAMQLVLLALAYVAGVFVAGMPPQMPPAFLIGSLAAVLASLSVAALQSLISMLIRSFAAPIAVAVVGCIAAVGIVLSGTSSVLAALVPYNLVTQSLGLGGSAISGSAALNLTEILKVAGPSLLLVAVITWLAAFILDRREVKA